MKKLLYLKFLADNLKTFIIIATSISLIVWVVQAVEFLDYVTEDGHGLFVYFNYTLLSFPKIIHRVIPFVFFISLFYQLHKYEIKNELLIFWTHGITKINLINGILTYSFLILIIQIFLGSIVSPMSQSKAKSFIRNSNVDFFPSLIKEGKFIDTVNDLTIFIESRDLKGVYKNIFLNDSAESGLGGRKSQMIYAKKGILIDKENLRYFELSDGRVINRDGDRITNFTFKKIDFDLSKYNSKSTIYPKTQEASSKDLIKCLYLDYKNKISNFRADYLRCTNDAIPDIKQEFLKRFYKPFYIPLLGLGCCFLILRGKENNNYNFIKILLFILIFSIIVISEVSLRQSSKGNIGLDVFYYFPPLFFFTIYIYLITILKNKN